MKIKQLREYLTAQQRKKYSQYQLLNRIRQFSDHYFGKGNDEREFAVPDQEPETSRQIRGLVIGELGVDITADQYRNNKIPDPKYPKREASIAGLLTAKKTSAEALLKKIQEAKPGTEEVIAAYQGRLEKMGGKQPMNYTASALADYINRVDLLIKKVASDPGRSGANAKLTGNLKVRVVRGVEVAGQTNSEPTAEHPSGHTWSGPEGSCKDILVGCNRHYIPAEIKAGTIAVFVVNARGEEIYRATLQPFFNKSVPSYELNDDDIDIQSVIYHFDAEYGMTNPVFSEIVHNIVKELNVNAEEMIEYHRAPGVYGNSGLARKFHVSPAKFLDLVVKKVQNKPKGSIANWAWEFVDDRAVVSVLQAIDSTNFHRAMTLLNDTTMPADAEQAAVKVTLAFVLVKAKSMPVVRRFVTAEQFYNSLKIILDTDVHEDYFSEDYVTVTSESEFDYAVLAKLCNENDKYLQKLIHFAVLAYRGQPPTIVDQRLVARDQHWVELKKMVNKAMSMFDLPRVMRDLSRNTNLDNPEFVLDVIETYLDRPEADLTEWYMSNSLVGMTHVPEVGPGKVLAFVMDTMHEKANDHIWTKWLHGLLLQISRLGLKNNSIDEDQWVDISSRLHELFPGVSANNIREFQFRLVDM